MSHWPDKYVIGLTGNIATGKSVVRKMLEHLGAYSIDADSLANRAMAKGAPAYQPVVDIFGSWILDTGKEIDRKKLGQLVFGAPDALRQLEEIVHPYVGQAIDLLVKRSKHDVIVIEAIKLLEGDLASKCDSIWVANASRSLQLTRLMEKQKLSEADAKQRIQAQGAQKDKIDAANIVINNTGSFEDLWKQVVAGWGEIALDSTDNAATEIVRETKRGDFSVQRGHPRNSEGIAELMTRLGKIKMDAGDVMAAFGEKAFFLLQMDGKLVGLAGWQVENLVTRTTDLYINGDISSDEGLKALVEEIEKASKSLQSEASLLFLNTQFAAEEAVLKNLGYEKRTPRSLGIQAWQEAAEEKPDTESTLFFKQLRIDRVLRPI
ncbi:MAG: dephospho-CoA kinase [Anaerolineales bacterium]|uniref:Dephospho-CoA kinase n=1 Tax=Candidatus Desulfolinea nitratireducens TaxID=2841698 RepID=A0A8J6NJ95_9CHLR|nr:dephospho-CoA kinase [Candidatus Desulfolinea nitratireducens]MBL6959890.1 dephospho-CoA kinase [Anaerolineales bacterium]